MNVSTHMPTCCPSDLMHSHTNMQVPSYEFPVHGFGLILKLLLLPGIDSTATNRWMRNICAATNHLLHIVDGAVPTDKYYRGRDEELARHACDRRGGSCWIGQSGIRLRHVYPFKVYLSYGIKKKCLYHTYGYSQA